MVIVQHYTVVQTGCIQPVKIFDISPIWRKNVFARANRRDAGGGGGGARPGGGRGGRQYTKLYGLNIRMLPYRHMWSLCCGAKGFST